MTARPKKLGRPPLGEIMPDGRRRVRVRANGRRVTVGFIPPGATKEEAKTLAYAMWKRFGTGDAVDSGGVWSWKGVAVEPGARFGFWTVLDVVRDPPSQGSGKRGVCLCRCGVRQSIRADDLRRGKTLACIRCAGRVKHDAYRAFADMCARAARAGVPVDPVFAYVAGVALSESEFGKLIGAGGKTLVLRCKSTFALLDNGRPSREPSGTNGQFE